MNDISAVPATYSADAPTVMTASTLHVRVISPNSSEFGGTAGTDGAGGLAAGAVGPN